MTMMIIMSMGWDYVREPRPPTGLLFILQVAYEQKLSGNPTSNVI
jgi:hypothetical protein